MLRLIKSKFILPVAGLTLVLGFGGASRADDSTTATPPASTQPAAKGTIVVTVVDADGKPVDGVTVSYKPYVKKVKGAPKTPVDSAGTTALATVTTDTNGKATIPAVADGDFTVQAKLKKTGTGRGKVTVADGKETDVTITLKPKA
jgi:hypothetical protein